MAAAALPAADRNGNSVHVSAFARLPPFVRPWRWWLSPSISDRFCYSDGVGDSLNVMKGCGRVNLRAAFSPKHNIGPACLSQARSCFRENSWGYQGQVKEEVDAASDRRPTRGLTPGNPTKPCETTNEVTPATALDLEVGPYVFASCKAK